MADRRKPFFFHLNKIKVVHIVEALGGGVYSYFIDLTHVLGSNPNIEAYIIYSDNRKEIDPKMVKLDFHPNVHLIRLNMVRQLAPLKDLKGVYKLRQHLRSIKPDVLHLHSSKAGVLGRIANFLIPTSTVNTYYTPHGYAFLRSDISQNKRRFFYSIEKYLAKYTNSVTIACGDSELELSKGFGKGYLIRNGINHNKLNTVNHYTHNDDKSVNVGILGRITYPRKPEFFNQLALKNPNLNFTWIGDGELRSSLTAHNIAVTGWFADRIKALAYLNTLDIYIQTSAWEGLPIAVIEAMALGKPVIATGIVGNKDLVLDGETGFLCSDLSSFNTALKKLKDPELRKIMGQKAQARVIERFNSTKNFNELINIYFEDLAKK